MRRTLVKKILLFLLYLLLSFALLWVSRTLVTFIHLIFSVIGMFLVLFFPYSLRNKVESNLLPLLFLVIPLANVPAIVEYALLGELSISTLHPFAQLFTFAQLFFLVVALFLSLFHFGINTSRIPLYTVVAFILVAFLALLIPTTPAIAPHNPALWIKGSLFFHITLLLVVLAIVSFVVLFFRELTLNSLLSYLSLSFIVAGNYLCFVAYGRSGALVGLALYALGVVMRLPRGRFSQL
jgi:hypothetical protein